MRIIRTLAAAFAIAAPGASTAQARSIDPPVSTAIPAAKAAQLDRCRWRTWCRPGCGRTRLSMRR